MLLSVNTASAGVEKAFIAVVFQGDLQNTRPDIQAAEAMLHSANAEY